MTISESPPPCVYDGRWAGTALGSAWTRSHWAPWSCDFHRNDTEFENPMIDEPYRPPDGSALMIGSLPRRCGSRMTVWLKPSLLSALDGVASAAPASPVRASAA